MEIKQVLFVMTFPPNQKQAKTQGDKTSIVCEYNYSHPYPSTTKTSKGNNTPGRLQKKKTKKKKQVLFVRIFPTVNNINKQTQQKPGRQNKYCL